MLSSFKISNGPISENGNTATGTPTTAPPDATTETPTTAPPDATTETPTTAPSETTTETPATEKADVVSDVIGGLYVINGQPQFANGNRDTIVVKNDPTQQHHVASNDEVRDTYLCFNETVGHSPNGAIPPPNTSPTSNQPSESAQTVIYNTSGDQYVWLSEVGAHGPWVTALASSMNQEFPTEDNSSLDASVPLLQPLWGTLKAFTAAGLARGSMLSGPPPLPEPTRECVNGSPLKPLVVLPARWVHRSPTRDVADESGMPILDVPPEVSLNMLSMAAQALLLSGPMAGTTPTFRVPIFTTGKVRSVADTVNAATMKGEPWGLLGVRGSADAKRIFRAAMLEDAPNAHVELLRAGRARVVRVLPSCGGAGGCTWCEEVTVAVPLHLRASATGRELQMAVWVSVTEIVCSNGSVAPHVADSLAAAVHLGALMGAEEGVTHVVVLGEDHVAHTLTHRGGDRQLFHNRLVGDSLGNVGHTFLEQVLGAWAGNGGCRGPRAVQAIVVEPSSTSSKEQCDVTSAALNTTLSDLVVDHHGVMFESTTVIVPSWPTTTTKTVTDEGDNCHSGHRCIKMKDMVNAIFHPFTTMEGVVSVRRRHQLPLKTRKVLGVVDAAAVQDVIQEGAASPHMGQHAVEAVDAVSPLSVCIEARSFAQVNGLYGRAGGRWVATVEDVVGALRSRIVPLMIRHRRRVECAAGGGGVVGAALRVLRVVTRHVVGHGASHAGGEESVVGSRLSSGLRDLTPINPPAPTPEEGIERPTLAQFVIRRSPLVAACARVVRIPVGVHVIREVAALDETTLRLLLTPRLVHMGDTQNTGFHEPAKETVDNGLVASAKRVSRALFRIVAGVPTSVCVPDGLFHVVRAHANAMASYQENDDHVSLEERLQREFSPWRHAQCSGGEDMAVCVARAHLRHMQQMLECDAMGEWLRRVSDDMRVLTQSDGTGTYVTKSFVEESISQATALGEALCQRWGCSWVPGARRAGKILYRQQHSTTAKVPGAESDVTRTLGLGDLSHIQLGNDSMMVSFIRSVLTSPLLDDVVGSTVSVGHTLQSRTDLCLLRTCSPFHVGATSHFIVGPLTLWQQWALRYVRMLLQTPKAPRHRLNTTSAATSEQGLVRAQSGHGRLFDGDWSKFAWGSLGARTKLSLDFALSRFIPSSDTPGSSPGAAALTNLVAAQTVEAADTHMKTALRHLSTTELTMMLRRPLMREALSTAETACKNDSRQVLDHPMPIARAVVRHLRMRSWDMGPDSVVDLVDRAKSSWLNCALKGLDWLERGHTPGPRGVESELYLWLSKKGAAQNITTAADRLSFMFARDLQCMLPPSTSQLDPDVNNLKILSSRAVAMAYTYLLSIVRHTAFDLLDSSSSIELLFKTTMKKPSFCKSSLGTAHPVGHDLSFDRSALLYRIPCYFCCGFMTEMKAYFPAMIEDKGLPLSISYQREECLCNMNSADPSHPQDVYRRSLLVSCDNGCNPTHLPPGSEKSFTDKEAAEEVYFGAKQRHYRGHQPPPQDGSKPGRSTAIWIDHAIPPHMQFSRDTVIPFVQVDRISDDRIAWGEMGKDMAPPLDRALARNLFTTYNDLGEVIHNTPSSSRSSNNSDPNDGSGYDSKRSGIIRSSTRGYRICRAMYEADRINQDWGRIIAHHCDEIWTPSNWGKRMYVNTFVTPHMELAFVPRTMDGDETSTRVCMGCVNLSASESSLLLPPTTSYQPVSINVDALRLRTDLKLSDEEMTIEHIQQRILSEEKNTLLQQLIEGLPYQVLAMLRQNQPAVQFINKEAYMTELVLAARNHAVTFDRLAHDARGHQPPNPPCNAATCRPPLVIGIGNSTHQLAYRLHLTSIFDLSKIVAMPESIDVNNMDPAIATPIDTSAPVKNSTKAPDNNDDKRPGTGGTIPDTSNLPDSTRPGLFQPGDKSFRWERWCSQKCFRGPRGNRRFISREESFRFLSVFKWEPRKGWSELMEAFYSAFYEPLYNNSANGKEPMLIIVGKSHMPIDTYSPVHFSSKLVEGWLQTTSLPVIPPHNQDKPSLGRPDFPCMCFITQALSDDDLVSVYRSVDAFVHLTRGEGWGLPISEAMTMGLPTISTNWGGSTEFTSHGSVAVAINVTHHDVPASYTVNATTFESPDAGDGYEANMRMAAPSIPHAMELLRKVYEESPKVNQEAGRRAREVIVREFSQAATTDLMAVRLAIIAQKLRWETDEEWEIRRQNNLKRGL